MGGQHQGMDRPGVRQVPDCSGEQGKMEKTGCEIICGVPTTLAVKGQMMMMMMMMMYPPNPPLNVQVNFLSLGQTTTTTTTGETTGNPFRVTL